MKEAVYTEKAPRPVGPYSQGVIFDKLIFVSGQIPINPETGDLVKGDFKEKARQAIHNMLAVIRAAGGDVDTLLKVNVYLRDISKFKEFNEVYSEIIGKTLPPARAVVEVSNLPLGVDVEIEAIGYRP